MKRLALDDKNWVIPRAKIALAEKKSINTKLRDKSFVCDCNLSSTLSVDWHRLAT